MQGIPRTLELGLWPDTSLGAPSCAQLLCSFPCPEATYALSLPALFWLTPGAAAPPATAGMSLVPPLLLQEPIWAGAQCRQQSKAPCAC